MKRTVSIFFLSLIALITSGQDVIRTNTGKVSFVSTGNVYVKFISTKGIIVGDTLFIQNENTIKPFLLVKNLSSTSALCESLEKEILPVDHVVIARIKEAPDAEKTKTKPDSVILPAEGSGGTDTLSTQTKKENVSGSLSAYSYSDRTNTGEKNRQRFRYSLTFKGDNLGGTKVSVESYVSFNHTTGNWDEVKAGIFNALKIYSMSLRYDIGKNTWIAIGRKINPQVTNLGSVDGLQTEVTLKNLKIGALTGFRPDYSDYGFNTALFQYGGYVSYNTINAGKRTGTSFALIQQMNGSNTDRRFLYFQHSNTLVKNLYLLGSFEADLFKLKNDIPAGVFSLTGLFISARYRASPRLAFSGSFDARKNVMYYETYKTFTDRIMESEMRQGLRFQGSYKIARDMQIGISSGYRFLRNDSRPSENINGYFTYSSIPGTGINATVSGTWIKSAHIDGITGRIYLYRELAEGKVQTGAGYRYVFYELPESMISIRQNIAEADISFLVFRRFFAGLNYEGTFEKGSNWHRLYIQARFRF